jgi:antitoxin PrlF
MDETEKETNCCVDATQSCCKIFAIVSVDAKGQMVLPKDLREAAGIAPGDKLAITTWERDGKVACLSLTRVNELAEMMKAFLEPLMKGLVTNQGKE